MTENQKHQELLIIKRYRGDGEAYHGGAWKIAFADFMTAMMALFLVLWLISATNGKTKASVARYFNPVNLVDMSTLKRGVHDPANGTASDGVDDSKAVSAQSQKAAEPKQANGPQQDDGRSSSVEPPPTHSEIALFRDPYAVLAEIAAKSVTSKGSDQSIGDGGAGGDAIVTYKDPFKTATTTPTDASPNAAATAADTPASVPAKSDSVAKVDQHTAPALPAAAKASAQQAATAQMAVNGPDAKTTPAPTNQTADVAQSDLQRGEADAGTLQHEIGSLVGKGEAAPNIEVKATDEGILIRLTDDNRYAMFAIGSAEPQPKTVQVMAKIAQLLKAQKGMIVISGHTDSRPYKSATYDNWRLSTARAQMAYYMLVRGGLDGKRIERIEGYADRKPKDPNNPMADENRRIEIFLQKDKP